MNLFQKLAVASVATVSSFTAINANPAQAATITQNFTTNLEFDFTSSFAQFAPGLGTLTSVSLDVNLMGTIEESCSSPMGCQAGNIVIISRLGSLPILSPYKTIPFPSPFVLGTESFLLNASLSGITNENLAGLYGSGTVPLQTDILIAAPKLEPLSASVTGTEEATLTYTYTPAQSVPEPSGNLDLDAVAIVGIEGLLLRKKVANSIKSQRTN